MSDEQDRIAGNGSTTPDLVNHPPHYTAGGIEHIEYVMDRQGWALGYCLGNASKYMHRAGLKDGQAALQDLKKARWYLDRYITYLEGGPNGQPQG